MPEQATIQTMGYLKNPDLIPGFTPVVFKGTDGQVYKQIISNHKIINITASPESTTDIEPLSQNPNPTIGSEAIYVFCDRTGSIQAGHYTQLKEILRKRLEETIDNFERYEISAFLDDENELRRSKAGVLQCLPPNCRDRVMFANQTQPAKGTTQTRSTAPRISGTRRGKITRAFDRVRKLASAISDTSSYLFNVDPLIFSETSPATFILGSKLRSKRKISPQRIFSAAARQGDIIVYNQSTLSAVETRIANSLHACNSLLTSQRPSETYKIYREIKHGEHSNNILAIASKRGFSKPELQILLETQFSWLSIEEIIESISSHGVFASYSGSEVELRTVSTITGPSTKIFNRAYNDDSMAGAHGRTPAPEETLRDIITIVPRRPAWSDLRLSESIEEGWVFVCAGIAAASFDSDQRGNQRAPQNSLQDMLLSWEESYFSRTLETPETSFTPDIDLVNFFDAKQGPVGSNSNEPHIIEEADLMKSLVTRKASLIKKAEQIKQVRILVDCAEPRTVSFQSSRSWRRLFREAFI